MSKNSLSHIFKNSYSAGKWQQRIEQVAHRFNQEYQNQPFELPEEIKQISIYRDWETNR